MSIESQQYDVLRKILAALNDADEDADKFRAEVLAAFAAMIQLLSEIAADLAPEPPPITFTPIKETSMVPLAAGQTATFSTTPIPANATPDPTKLIWTSSDAVAFPLTPNAVDPSGLSINLTFPAGTAGGVSFSLILSYANADGTTATQTNSFVTVAAVTDVTGFNPIVQSA